MQSHGSRKRWSTSLTVLLVLLIVGAGAAYVKLEYLGTTHSSDWDTYILTAQYLAGEVEAVPGDISIPQRLLKPLYPAYLATLEPFLDFDTAALLQTVFFYLLFIVAMYFLAKEFFEDEFLTIFTVLLTAFSYPVLKYGLDVYTETGSWFSYVVSLLLTLLFVKRPSWGLFLANVAVITVGFWWKEYIIVAAIVFGLTLLFHTALTSRQKALYIGTYAAIFLAAHTPWQLYVFHVSHFSYLDWYGKGATGFGYEFTLKNIVKSTAALLGVMWLLAPLGFIKLRDTPSPTRLFAYASAFPPFIGYVWGFVSSRLLYVVAPPMMLIAVLGMKDWGKVHQVAVVAVALTANIGWLILSYRVTL